MTDFDRKIFDGFAPQELQEAKIPSKLRKSEQMGERSQEAAGGREERRMGMWGLTDFHDLELLHRPGIHVQRSNEAVERRDGVSVGRSPRRKWGGRRGELT